MKMASNKGCRIEKYFAELNKVLLNCYIIKETGHEY